MPISHARRVYVILRELPELVSRVKQLEKGKKMMNDE
jgi:hypothetical protein